MKLLTITMALLLLSACETVQPWERGTLARPEMQWQGDRMEASLQDHIHYSKEASSGGKGAAGGGCGCN
jgi:hypothetical protein